MKQITIVGGGLAGLTLGIGLRRRQVPATILEAGRYPRHRVCGEFVSGRGQKTLERFGLLPLLEQAGARPALTASLVAERSASRILRLPSPALCLSRYHMDKTLADEFVELGGKLEVQMPWRGSLAGEGLVVATGRKHFQSTRSIESWFGLKAHLHGMILRADLELHLQPNGYIGLCRLNSETVNVCGLFRKLPDRQAIATCKLDLLRSLAEPALRRRIEDARADEASCCAVAGLCYKPPRAANVQECLIGDSLALIPPFTGNGMSMAFEAAELSLDPLTRYSLGRLDWSQAVQQVRVRCRQRFAARLAWARTLQSVLFLSWSRRVLGSLLFRSDFAWRMLFGQTR